jgi:teichoic acid transport system permease protein
MPRFLVKSAMVSSASSCEQPVTLAASGYRKSFIYKQWFFEDPVELGCYGVTFLVFFLLSLWAFKKLRKDIPDVM